MEEQKNNNVVKSIINGIRIVIWIAVRLFIVLFSIFALWIAYLKYFSPNYTINVNLRDNIVIVKQFWPVPDKIARISGWHVWNETTDIPEDGKKINFQYQSNIDGLLEYVNEEHITVSIYDETIKVGTFTNAITDKKHTVLVIPSSRDNKIVLLLDALVITEKDHPMGNDTVKLNVTL
mgnify:CR=1 FL=1